jgi:hypothetical protein
MDAGRDRPWFNRGQRTASKPGKRVVRRHVWEDLLFLLQAFANGFDGPLLFRKLARLELGVNQLAVDTQLEAAAAQRNQLQLANLLLIRGQELARQTDGLRLIISHRTVLELYIHVLSLSFGFSHTSPVAKVHKRPLVSYGSDF